jgi:cysteine-rich repeat protein
VVYEGSLPTDAPTTVSNVYFPHASGGRVAISGLLSGGEAFVFIEDRVVWVASDALPLSVGSIDAAMGSQGMDRFVIRANIDGAFGLLTEQGPYVVPGDVLPGGETGFFSAVARPTMDAAGGLSFRALIDADDGGSTFDAAVLFHSPDGTLANLAPLLRSGDTVDGVLLDDGTSAVDNDFSISEDGLHFVSVASAEGSSTTNALVIVDDTVLAREGDPVPGQAANWQTFDLVSVNNAGDVLVTGDDSGPSSVDEFLAYNDVVQAHEGDLLDGVGVVGPVRQATLNNAGQAAFTWASSDISSNQEVVFFACDAGDMNTAQLVLALGDTLDIDDDGIGDVTVTDVHGSTSEAGKILSDDMAVYVEVDIDPGDIDAIVRLPVSCCGDGVLQADETCDDGNDDDTDACPSSCSPATCGDGFVQAGAEGCDDGNDDETDDCLSTCVAAACGDGFVQAGVEACDDGNLEDGDGCDASCALEEPETSSTTAGSTSTTGEGSTSSSGGGASTSDTDASSSGSSTGEASDDTSTGSPAGSTSSGMIPSGEDGSSSSSGTGGLEPLDDDGCGCVASSGSQRLGLALMLVVLGLRRRRR